MMKPNASHRRSLYLLFLWLYFLFELRARDKWETFRDFSFYFPRLFVLPFPSFRSSFELLFDSFFLNIFLHFIDRNFWWDFSKAFPTLGRSNVCFKFFSFCRFYKGDCAKIVEKIMGFWPIKPSTTNRPDLFHTSIN